MENNNTNEPKIAPRPKPNVSNAAPNGSQVIGGAPKMPPRPPRPNFNQQINGNVPRPRPQMPFNANSMRPQQPPFYQNPAPYNNGVNNPYYPQNPYMTMQPQPITQEPEKDKKEETNQAKSSNEYAFQAYNTMLNNMQFMNAVGLINGIYQNAQNNATKLQNQPQNQEVEKPVNKEELFEEFYDYISKKLAKEEEKAQEDADLLEAQAIAERLLSGEEIDEDTEEEEIVEDVDDNIELDIPEEIEEVEEYEDEIQEEVLEEDQQEDEAEIDDRQAVMGANEEGIELDEYLSNMCIEDEIIEMDIEPLSLGEPIRTPQSKSLQAVVKPFNIGKLEKVEKYTQADYENLLERNVDYFLNPKEDDVVEDLTDVPDLIEMYSEQVDQDINDILQDEDVVIQEEVQNLSEKKLSKDDELKQALVSGEIEEDDQIEPNYKPDYTIERVKYGDIVELALNKEKIEEENKQKLNKDLEESNKEKDELENQVEELQNILSMLKEELGDYSAANQTLKETVDITNTRNKEKDNAIVKERENIRELVQENQLMRNEVLSLSREIEELKSLIERNQNDIIKANSYIDDYEVLKPDEEIAETNENVIEEKEVALDENLESNEQQEDSVSEENQEVQNIVEEQSQINEVEYDQENLQTIDMASLDDDSYNVDGIIIEEDTMETSQHFVDKMHLAPDDIKAVYNEIRNEIMSYKDVKGRCSSACDTFRLNGDIIAKFLLIGKTMKLYLALNPDDANLPQNIYHQKDERKKKAYKETPFMVKLQSPLSVRKAVKLIDYMFEKLDVVKNKKYVEVDYANTLERQVVKKDDEE